MHYQIPARGEQPSEEMIGFLHENSNVWEGDDEGVVLFDENGEVASFGTHGDWIVRDEDGNYGIEHEKPQ